MKWTARRDRDCLALATGERPTGVVKSREVRVQAAHHLAGRRPPWRHRRGCPPGSPVSRPRNTLAGASTIVGQRQGLVDASRCPNALASRGIVDGGRLALDQDLARVCRCAPESVRMRVDFPAPLPPTRPDDLARLEVDVHVVDGMDAAEGNADVAASPPAACVSLPVRLAASSKSSSRLQSRPSARRRLACRGRPPTIRTMPATTSWVGEFTAVEAHARSEATA